MTSDATTPSATSASDSATPAGEPPTSGQGLSAVLINCTLDPDPARSHTGRLLDVVDHVMTGAGVSVERVHAVAHDIAPGVQPDMREHGFAHDAWPDLWPTIREADILVIGTPLWLGEESSVCRRVIERLYAQSGQLNERGQSDYYGRVGGAVVTGNEDGVKHTSMTILYAMQHLGYTIPPQADCGWIGEIGPGTSYGDPLEDGSGTGYDNDFTQRNATIMSWNLIHTARLLKDAGGLPSYGNDRSAWAEGARFGYADPQPLPKD